MQFGAETLTQTYMGYFLWKGDLFMKVVVIV